MIKPQEVKKHWNFSAQDIVTKHNRARYRGTNKAIA